jgi:hypothetical protein
VFREPAFVHLPQRIQAVASTARYIRDEPWSG